MTGPWWTTALAGPSDVDKMILAPEVKSGGSLKTSGVAYTCDEFPAASWIEGGDGTNVSDSGPGSGKSQTRCAGSQCRAGPFPRPSETI